MPSGKTHLKIEMAALLACLAAVAFLQYERMIDWRAGGTFLFAYLFSSVFLSPDLDLSQSRASQRWGIGRILWLPYAVLCQHRRLSHHLLFGPLTRILYLGAVVLAVFWGISFLVGHSVSFSVPSWQILVAIFLGLYLPNQIHILVDRGWSFRRKQSRKRL